MLNITRIRDLYVYFKSNSVIFSNYFFILYAFFLPLSKSASNVAFSFIIFLFFLNGDLKNKLKFILKNNVIIAILLFVLLHFLWLFGTDDFAYGIDKLAFMKHFLSIIIITTMVLKDYVFKIIGSFLISMLFSEISSYSIFFGFIDPFNNATINNPVPFMLNHGFYSTFLSVTLGILLFTFLKKDIKTNYISKFITLFFSTTIIFNMLIISSRLGYVLIFSVVFVMSMIFFRKYFIKMIILCIVILITFYTVAYNNITNFQVRIDQANKNIKKIFTMQDYTTSEGIRFGFHVYGLKILEENPIFGVGTGDHINYVRHKIKDSEYKNPSPMLHILSGGVGTNLIVTILMFLFNLD